jgi:hypothetical protein
MTDQELRDLLAGYAADAEARRRHIEQLQANTDSQLAETDAQLAATDAQLAANAVQMAKTEAKLNRLAEMYGGVSNSQGAVAEEFFYNSLKDKPELNGATFDTIYKNISGAVRGVEDEFDLVLVNDECVFIIEVKYKAHRNDLERLLNKKRRNFNAMFPQYRDLAQHWGLASFHLSDELKHAALEHGIHLLQRKGDLIQTLAA